MAHREEIATARAGIVAAIQRGVGAVALAVVQRDAALEMGHGPSHLAHRHEGRPQGVVGLEVRMRSARCFGV
jgi:hypothetical protein